MSLEDFIKGLDLELQEKARACGSVEELLALAKEAKVPLPDGELAAIAGGDQPDPENCRYSQCPKCGSTNIESVPAAVPYMHCEDCGYNWY